MKLDSRLIRELEDRAHDEPEGPDAKTVAYVVFEGDTNGARKVVATYDPNWGKWVAVFAGAYNTRYTSGSYYGMGDSPEEAGQSLRTFQARDPKGYPIVHWDTYNLPRS